MSGIPRKRISLCCTECNRRKVKCDKRIPCGRCAENGLQDACARAPFQRSSKPQAVTESALQRPARDSLVTFPPDPTTRAPPEAPVRHPSVTEHDEITNAATILEFLAWGIRKEVSYATQLSPYVDEPTALLAPAATAVAAPYSPSAPGGGWHEDGTSCDNLQLLLPERAKVFQLVDYHLTSLLWYHGSLHGPTFRGELTEFYEKDRGDLNSPGLDLQWVALLFAVLAGSIACGNKSVVLSWGFQEAEQEILSRRWLHAVVTCLNAAQYMANPSMRSCEAIATLTISAHILGYSNQQSVLLASAVRIAQSLGLHRLGDTSRKSVERETGRRVWIQLCSQDWFSIPCSECYLINPIYSQTTDPVNCDDTTLEELPASEPTVTSYCRYLYSIAALMPRLQDGIVMSNTLFTQYEQVMKYDQKMRSLASEHRPIYLCNVPLEPSWPRWITWARSAAAISSSHKIIMIHRKFLTMSFTNPAFAFTRRTCIAASKTILKEVPRLTSENGPVLWIFHAFTVAASITLCLDVFHRDTSDPICMEHCGLVEGAVALLKAARNSKIASRGFKILTDMLLLEHKSRISRMGNKRRAESDTNQSRAKKHHSVDLRDVVRDLQHRTSISIQPAPVPEDVRLAQQPGLHSWLENEETYHARFASAEGADSVRTAFLAAEETLSDFQTSYFAHDTDAFGNLLNLAQTYSYY